MTSTIRRLNSSLPIPLKPTTQRSSSVSLAGCRYSLPAQQTVACEGLAIQLSFCGRCLNATLKNATFGC
jgi:hypothetical protein